MVNTGILYHINISRDVYDEFIKKTKNKSVEKVKESNKTIDKKTKKKRPNEKERINKKHLWNIFKNDKLELDKTKQIECVYSTPKDENLCNACNSYLLIVESFTKIF